MLKTTPSDNLHPQITGLLFPDLLFLLDIKKLKLVAEYQKGGAN